LAAGQSQDQLSSIVGRRRTLASRSRWTERSRSRARARIDTESLTPADVSENVPGCGPLLCWWVPVCARSAGGSLPPMTWFNRTCAFA
jgi:hypothetical protein